MTLTITKNETLFEYDSWGAFVNAAEHGETDMAIRERSSHEHRLEDYGRLPTIWHGTRTMAEAIDLARRGWIEGAQKVKQRLELLHAHMPARVQRQEMVMSQVGPGTLDMHRYQIGHPAPWVTWEQRSVETDDVRGQVVPIIFNITASAGVSTEGMFDKGATICALVDLLERTGRRCELILAMATRPWDTSIIVKIMVKRANDPLDPDRMAFALAHAACFRRLGFSVLEQAPSEHRRACGIPGTYGRCRDITQEGAINILSSDLYSTYREADQFSWLKKQLADHGITLELD